MIFQGHSQKTVLPIISKNISTLTKSMYFAYEKRLNY